MKDSQLKHKKRPTSEVRLASVLDLVTTCPRCGGEVGLWSEASETLCDFCQYRVFEKERTVH